MSGADRSGQQQWGAMWRLPPLASSRGLQITAALVVAAGVLAGIKLLTSSSTEEPPALISIHAESCQRRVIYHSPQTPGYTSWVGAWVMPDKSLMTAFTQATGPTDYAKRAHAPDSVKQALGATERPPGYDFWGLELSVEYLRSTNGGSTWSPFRSDRFEALYPHAYAAQATIGLPDGSILRRVNGHDLMHDPSVPHTAFLQRLPPQGETWSAPQVLMDPSKYTYQLSRLRRLRDGRLVATGQFKIAPAGTPQDELAEAPGDHLLLVSDDEGETWTTNPVKIPSGGYLAPDEWDVAELPSGDLLAVFRTRESSSSSVTVRRQGLLKKRGDGWVLTNVRDAPFPHSGHPELLSLREGAVLHIATSGIHWTADGGETWKPLRFRHPRVAYGSTYYPESVQTNDGTVYVFGHDGSDDPYGAVDQSIVLDKFRLVTDPPTGSSRSPAPGRRSAGGC